MRRNIICFCILLGLYTAPVSAGEIREIELMDGSYIYGEMVALEDGVYTIESVSLGRINLESSKIKAIRSNTPSEPMPLQLEGIQKKILSSQDLMGKILSLQDDPDFQDILDDPSILKAITSGDITTLLSNPKFMKLLDNPRIREISEEIQK